MGSSNVTDPTPLSLSETIESLASPYASERYSHLTGEALLIVDLRAPTAALDSGAAARAKTQLDELPCPSIAIGAPDLAEPWAEWAPAFDLLLDDPAQLPQITRTIHSNPIASLAMVQLLRQSESLSIHRGLIAESLVYSTLQSGPEFASWLRDRKPPRPADPEDEPAVAMLRDGPRLHITLNRPDRRNAFSAEMRDSFAEALQVVQSDPSLEEVILRGAGPAFCSGGDLAEFGTLPDPATAHVIRSTRNPARLIASCADRVRCEVHGACVGAGIELPAFTFQVQSKADATLWLPEISMGLVPGAGGTVSLPRRIGRQRTNYLAFSQQHIDAETALAWGLVDELI
jgi:enoyl-CoA hydratase